MTTEAIGTAQATLVRLLALLAEEAPLEQFHDLLAEQALLTSSPDAAELSGAVRSALGVRALLASRRRREQELSALYETAGDLSSLRDL